jgi:hypothetical protein
LGDDINTTKKNTEVLVDANKDGGLEVNTEKTKYISISYHQNGEQNRNLKRQLIGEKRKARRNWTTRST